ncbi:MAG TPA: YopX family protein [Paludibacter sp.]
MEREIKFKFWLGRIKKMTNEQSLVDIAHSFWDFTEDIIPLQFIGSNDKNGDEIYDGDVLTYDYADCKEFKEWMINPCYVVKYCEDNNYVVAGIGIKNKSYCHAFRFKHCEILGNIYENPKLLKI